MSEDDI